MAENIIIYLRIKYTKQKEREGERYKAEERNNGRERRNHLAEIPEWERGRDRNEIMRE